MVTGRRWIAYPATAAKAQPLAGGGRPAASSALRFGYLPLTQPLAGAAGKTLARFSKQIKWPQPLAGGERSSRCIASSPLQNARVVLCLCLTVAVLRVFIDVLCALLMLR